VEIKPRKKLTEHLSNPAYSRWKRLGLLLGTLAKFKRHEVKTIEKPVILTFLTHLRRSKL